MTEETKKPKKKSSGKPISESARTTIQRGMTVFALDFIKLELTGGRSSMLLAFAGINHLNDFLHSAGLITDDCWNDVKGTATLFATTTNIATIATAAGSVLKTLVEGATEVTTAGMAQQTKLAALGGAAAEEAA
jgi:hypothetical protein